MLPSKMKSRILTVATASVLLLAAIVLWLRLRPSEGAPDASGNTEGKPARVSTKPISRASDANRRNPRDAGESPSADRPLSREAILARIEDAAVTYDAKALPRIQPYLLDSDPVLREAAINGMIVLGDAAAGPMLREASRHVTSPHEAVRLLEAADYVELPSGLPALRKRSAAPSPEH